MGKVIDDRKIEQIAYNKVLVGTAFLYDKDLYMKTDLVVQVKQVYVSVKLETGEIREFNNDDQVEIVFVEHHIVK